MAAKKKKVDGRTKEGKSLKKKATARESKKDVKKPKLKPVRGTTKKTVDKAKLHKVSKKDPRPRVGSVVLFTQGEGRRMTFGLGIYDSRVGDIANVIVGEKPAQRTVFAGVHELYKPLPTEKALHAFVVESIREAYERGFRAGEHSALGQTHSVVAPIVGGILDIPVETVALKTAEEEAPKSDDMSLMYAAFAKRPEAQQVVERAEELLDSDVRVSPDPEAVREAIEAVHEEQTEAEKLAIISEVQKAPLL
jgi:hypothetical protein